jgi:hypothetical protein
LKVACPRCKALVVVPRASSPLASSVIFYCGCGESLRVVVNPDAPKFPTKPAKAIH